VVRNPRHHRQAADERQRLELHPQPLPARAPHHPRDQTPTHQAYWPQTNGKVERFHLSHPGFDGGSYVVVQKYRHDLDAWNELSVEQQELAVGRTKLSDIELPDERKPANSHVALNTIEDDEGNQQQIVRANMPFGSVSAGEFGTYFIGYARTPDVIEQMLRNMFIGDPPGNYDRLLDFSTAVTGNLFFVPSASFLDDPDSSTDEPEAPAPQSPVPDADDGSLHIGSLLSDVLPGV
jgi:porphyrinogen peroxidase